MLERGGHLGPPLPIVEDENCEGKVETWYNGAKIHAIIASMILAIKMPVSDLRKIDRSRSKP